MKPKLSSISCGAFLALALTAWNLSAEEAWTVLFDGKPTKRLCGYRQSSFPDRSWIIAGNALKTVPGKAVDLITVEKYEDFELDFEWKVAAGGNSGVMYRVAETNQPTYWTGPEYQCLDNAGHGDGKNPKTSAGSLYALIAPDPANVTKPAGEWNESKIKVQQNRVEHWLNGTKVVEYTWSSDEIKALIAKSKFKDMPGFMTQRTGHIAFQHHGEEAWFRNIRARKL
jgi:hypothetical protein